MPDAAAVTVSAVPAHDTVGKRQRAAVVDAAAAVKRHAPTITNSDSAEVYCDSGANNQDSNVRAQALLPSIMAVDAPPPVMVRLPVMVSWARMVKT